MTKGDLVARMAEETGVSKAQSLAYLNTLRDIAAEELQGGRDFTLPGVARFTIVHRKARRGRNVQTGAAIEIPARDALKAKVIKSFQTDVVG